MAAIAITSFPLRSTFSAIFFILKDSFNDAAGSKPAGGLFGAGASGDE
jgi:hypothetical protein